MSDMSEWRTILGKAVRERRQAFELTLDEASRVIGISRSHLNLIELGKATGISRECAERIDANLDFNGELLALLPTARPSTPISLDSREAGCARLLCCPGSDDTMKALVTDGSVTLRTADLN